MLHILADSSRRVELVFSETLAVQQPRHDGHFLTVLLSNIALPEFGLPRRIAKLEEPFQGMSIGKHIEPTVLQQLEFFIKLVYRVATGQRDSDALHIYQPEEPNNIACHLEHVDQVDQLFFLENVLDLVDSLVVRLLVVQEGSKLPNAKLILLRFYPVL